MIQTVDLISAARRVKLQLDARTSDIVRSLPPPVRMAIQALKVAEEAGELAKAANGVLGENPRKGVSHDVDDCVNEAIDVAVSALVLVEMAVPGRSGQVVADRLAWLAARATASGAPDVAA